MHMHQEIVRGCWLWDWPQPQKSGGAKHIVSLGRDGGKPGVIHTVELPHHRDPVHKHNIECRKASRKQTRPIQNHSRRFKVHRTMRSIVYRHRQTWQNCENVDENG